MAKLYPPVLAGTIPAFSGTSIEVPFSMSRAVSVTEVAGLVLKVKKIGGAILGTVTISGCPNPAKFSVAGLGLAIGEFYKVQLAYISTDREVGFFSTVGIVKYTSTPRVIIDGLDPVQSNNHNYVYTGLYRQANYDEANGTYMTEAYDTSEKLYSSRFRLYDENYTLIKDTGDILHNAHGDVSAYEATDTFEFHDDLEIDKPYYIEYIATTSNGMVVSSPRYKLNQRRLRPMILNAHLEVKNNFDTGAIQVNLVQDTDELASGLFLLSRSSSRNPNKWEPMKEFALQSEYPSRILYNDYTVEQGITYRYSLQQYNNHNIYSERRISNSVTADFEDLFLYDGERQLAVRFNPKVATFKENKMEQKTETIGNKYPFIIKNGSVAYKELSISGLISYQMDEIEQFMSKDDLELPYNTFDKKRYSLRDPVTDNIRAERIFKTEVLSWLNNGGIKLYRSPTEGNFVVRLMNVTTSPMDQLGRMLHTFNCVAYEMAEPTYDSLISFGILEPAINTPQTMRWKTVDLREIAIQNAQSANPKDFIQINKGMNLGIESVLEVYSIDFEGLAPGSYFLAGESELSCQKIFIGSTGSYHYVTENPYTYIAIPAKIGNRFIEYSGNFNFGYKGWVKSSFDLITDVKIIDVVSHQFIGDAYTRRKGEANIISDLTDIKHSVLAVKYIKLFPREIHPLYYDPVNDFYYLTEKDLAHGGIHYTPEELPAQLNMLHLYKLYHVRGSGLKPESGQSYEDLYLDIKNEDYYLDQSFKETPEFMMENRKYVYIDPYMYYWKRVNNRLNAGENITNCKIFSINDMELYNVTIGNDTINMYDVFYNAYHGFEDVQYISNGPGVIMELGYQMQESTYNFELEDSVLHNRYVELYGNRGKLKNYIAERQKLNASTETVNALLSDFRALEEDYINQLTDKIQSYREENNLNE